MRVALQTRGGIGMTLSGTGVNYVVSTVLPDIEAAFENLTIPGISGTASGFDYALLDITCPGLSIGSAAVQVAAPDHVGISLSNLNMKCGAQYWYKPHGWSNVFKEKGSVSIALVQTSGSVTVAVSNTNLNPSVALVSASINVGSLQINFMGNWLDWLINLFKPFIESAIQKAVDTKFSSIVQTIVTTANAGLAKLPMASPLKLAPPFDIAEFRYGLTAPPIAQQGANGGFMGLQLEGDIVPLNFPGVPPVPPANIPPFDGSSDAYYAQLQVSSYTAMSALWTFWSKGLFSFPIPSADLPLGLNETSAYASIVPGLPKAFPNGVVSVVLSLGALPDIDINPATQGGITMQWPLLFSFEVTTATQPTSQFAFDFTALANATLTLNATSPSGGGFIISGDLKYISSDLVAGNSTVGPESGLPLISDLVDFVLADVLEPIVNKVLGPGIPLPHPAGVTFTKSTLQLENTYILIGIDFTLA